MIPYIGGKKKMQSWIIPKINKDIETYCEPFSGQFWTFFSMDLKQFSNLKKVVYNDFNPLNYNLFKCIQNPTELLRAINSIDCQKFGMEITPSIYKEQFIRFQAEIFNEGFIVEPGDYEVAAKYVYILTQVFSGSKPETSSFIDLKGKYNSKYHTFRDKLGKTGLDRTFLKDNSR
jgi:site-specific DNA-adenine methylase